MIEYNATQWLIILVTVSAYFFIVSRITLKVSKRENLSFLRLLFGIEKGNSSQHFTLKEKLILVVLGCIALFIVYIAMTVAT